MEHSFRDHAYFLHRVAFSNEDPFKLIVSCCGILQHWTSTALKDLYPSGSLVNADRVSPRIPIHECSTMRVVPFRPRGTAHVGDNGSGGQYTSLYSFMMRVSARLT
jgi:hypothetical protein